MPPVFRSQMHSSITVDGRLPNTKAQQVVSALERLILTQDKAAGAANVEYVDPKKDLTVYADVVEIRGPLVLPGRIVRIFARILAGSKDSRGEPAAVDVSGAKPADAKARVTTPAKLSPADGGSTALAALGFHNDKEKPGKDGANGAPGSPGSAGDRGASAFQIEVACAEPDPNLQLALIARGGNGQDGQPGQNGQAGQDGGPGAQGTAGFGGIGLKHGTNGGKGGNGGDGGPGGVGGSGGSGGEIVLSFTKGFRANMITTDVRAGDMGSPGECGTGGKVGSGGKSYPEYTSSPFNDGWIELPYKDGAEGDRAGTTPEAIVNPPNQAKPGREFSTGDFLMEQLSLGWHPAQCVMMMQRIRSAYLSADPVENPDAFRTTAGLLEWMQSLTYFWTTQVQTYPKNRQFTAIYRQSVSLAQGLQMGLTYYGHPRSFAPRASLGFYKESLEAACKRLKDLEGETAAYQEALEKHQDTAKQLLASDSNAEKRIKALDDRRDEITGRRGLVEGALKAAQDKVIAQEREVSEKLADFQTELAQEGLSVGALVKILGSITPPKEGGAMDILKIAGKTAMELKDLHDKEAKTQYKINRIGFLREGLKPLAEAYKESEGALTLADPNGYKLIASRKRLDEELKKYWGTKSADDVRAAVDRLLDFSEQRNQLVLDYNALGAQLLDVDAQKSEATEQRAAAAAALQQNSRPDLPEFAAWVADLYEKARAGVIEQVYMASRAYSWWALKEFPIYARLGLKSASTVTAAILEAAQDELLRDFAKTVEGRGTAPSPFPSKEARKVDPAATGAVVRLDADHFSRAFQELKSGKVALLQLPPTLPYTSMVPLRRPEESGNMKDFALMAEVMVQKIRVYLRGAKTRDNKFAIRIVHGGVNDVVRRDGRPFVFTSVPVHVTFKYDQVGAATKITGDGNITEETRGGAYAPLSPFGWWSIEVDPIFNSDLDLSGLTAVDIEFHGDAYSFPS